MGSKLQSKCEMHSKEACGGRTYKKSACRHIGVYLKGSGFTPLCLKIVEGGRSKQLDNKIPCLIKLINFNVRAE